MRNFVMMTHIKDSSGDKKKKDSSGLSYNTVTVY